MVNTGVELAAGEEVTIFASRWIKYGKEEYALAVPFGRVKSGCRLRMSPFSGPRFIDTGKGYDTGNGVCKWAASESGTLRLCVADTGADNTDAFQARVYK